MTEPLEGFLATQRWQLYCIKMAMEEGLKSGGIEIARQWLALARASKANAEKSKKSPGNPAEEIGPG